MKPADRSVTTPYGAKGDWWATGEHGGVDYGCPTGDPVYAMWGGTVTGASWGSAYGTQVVIDHDKLPDGSPGLWAVYAHLKSKTVSSGERVEAGDLIGYSGATGNVSGPHLHVEVQPQAHWVQGSYRNPQPWIDAGAVAPGDVYLSKLHYGQEDSDSVRRLQLALNGHSLAPPGDITLPVTGGYFDQTDTVVRADQAQHGYGNDPAKGSSVGPKQAEHLFAGTGNTIINDLETTPPEEPTVANDDYWYSGKPAGTFTVSGESAYKRLDFDKWAPKSDGLILSMLYLNVAGEGEFKVRLIRDPDDATAYQTYYAKSGDHFLLTHVWFEWAEANRKLWWEIACADAGYTLEVGTRYAKFALVS